MCTPKAKSTDTESVLSDYSDIYGEMFENQLGASGAFSDIVPDFNASFKYSEEEIMKEFWSYEIDDILKQLNSGDFSVSPRELVQYILKLLLGEVYDGARLMALVLAMSVLSSYLSGLKSGFGGAAVADCAFYACYTVISGIASAAFYEAAVCATQTIENIAVFMRFIVPVIVTALLTGGAAVSAATLEPTILAIVEVAVWVIEVVLSLKPIKW